MSVRVVHGANEGRFSAEGNTVGKVAHMLREVFNVPADASAFLNGQQTVLRREGDYLCYDDNRCKILDEHVSGGNVQFFAASHGAEVEPHVIIRPDRIVLSKDELVALAKAEAKLKAAASDFGALSERVDGVASAYVSTISELIDGLVAAIDNDLRQSN